MKITAITPQDRIRFWESGEVRGQFNEDLYHRVLSAKRGREDYNQFVKTFKTPSHEKAVY